MNDYIFITIVAVCALIIAESSGYVRGYRAATRRSLDAIGELGDAARRVISECKNK